MTDPGSIGEGVTLEGDGAESPRLALVVYHRDGLEVVPLLDRSPVVIGRTEPSDIRPRSRRLSRRHAQFESVEGEVWVEDLRSTNGTFVNGARITARTPVAMGDEVTLGSVTVALHGVDEAWLRPLGLEGHERFVAFVDGELDRARTFERPLAVVMIRARDPGGPRLGSWVPAVAERLRLVDRAALYGPDCVEVLLPEMDGLQAAAFAQQLVTGLVDVIAVVVGVATYPEGGSSGAQLTEAARSAVMAATPTSPVEVYADPAQAGALPVLEGEGPVIRDPSMLSLYRTVDRVAASAISVLIIGETGTGKELIARAIHERSDRAGGPMRVINCGAIPESLLESVLFGHERGAFTGADQRRVGVFEEADHGTVFLDEVGELSLQAQVALLRVLEARRIQRVGAHQEIAVDVRVVAATHRNLEAMCDDGSFRWDLLYRLNGITLMVPPLRERPSEIRHMTAKFVQESNQTNGRAVRGIAPDALLFLERYHWPGNVRELRNVVDRAVVIAQGDTITTDDLPRRLVASVDLSRLPTDVTMPTPSGALATRSDLTEEAIGAQRRSPGSLDLKERVRAYEIELIRSALADADGNQTQAAELLSMPRRTLVYKMRGYDLRPGEPALPLPADRDERGRPLSFARRVERFEQGLIEEAMARSVGDVGLAARLLNVQRRTLAQKLERNQRR
ncbi:MAG: sigma 54-interacting transcriptional regulator [Myxococcota bacterium]